MPIPPTLVEACRAAGHWRLAPSGTHLQAEHFLSCRAGLPQPVQRGSSFTIELLSVACRSACSHE